MIYLDANATSRLRPQAVKVIENMLHESSSWSNPSSVHGLGRRARSMLSKARNNVHSLISNGEQIYLTKGSCGSGAPEQKFGENLARSASIFFTSGGTESCNSLVNGFLSSIAPSVDSMSCRGHLLSTALEHPAMIKSLSSWQSRGFELTLVEPGLASSSNELDAGVIGNASVTVEQILGALRDDTQIVSVMAANNETGALQPVGEIAIALRAAGYRGAIISDITQAIGKSVCDVYSLFKSGVDGIALSGHKLGAPAGVGVVALRGCGFKGNDTTACLNFTPMLLGGEQEEGLRSGTENLLGIVALGAVCEHLAIHVADELAQRKALRDLLFTELRACCPDCMTLTPLRSNAHAGQTDYIGLEHSRSLVNTLLVRFPGCRSDDLVVALDLEGVAVSAGSACHSGKQGVSSVLRAMHVGENEAREYVRISLDWDATSESVLEGCEKILRVVSRMRESD